MYEDLELWYPTLRLEEEGWTSVVAGLGEKTYQGKKGYPVSPDATVDEVDAKDFDALVIPGGYAPDILRRSPRGLALTQEAEGDLALEIADILLVLICIANREGIDLQQAFDRMMEKVERRDTSRWTK